MDPNKKMMLMFRIRDHEIVNLQNTLAFLTEQKQLLTIDETYQQNYQKSIDSAPIIVQERDNLIKELENVANLKFEESNHTDITANMCLYLINKQRQAETLVSQLQDQYIESKYGERFLKAYLANNDSIPNKLETIKPKYSTLKHDLEKIIEGIDEIQAVKQNTKRELDNLKKSNRESERSVPETARNMLYQVNEFDKQLIEISKKVQKKQSEYNDKKSKYEKRISLINDIIQDLKEELTEQINTPAEKIVNELKLILENINSENQSSKFIKSRINTLLKSISIPKIQQKTQLSLIQPQNMQKQPSPDIKKSNFQDFIKQNQQLTPNAKKNVKPILTPQRRAVPTIQYKTPIEVRQRQGTASQSIKDLKEKYRLLREKANPMPSFFVAPSVKSPE